MMKRLAYSAMMALLMVGLLSACKSNNKLNRGVASLTTRYNVYFNGNEAYKQSLKSMEENSDKDDYSQRLKLSSQAHRSMLPSRNARKLHKRKASPPSRNGSLPR